MAGNSTVLLECEMFVLLKKAWPALIGLFGLAGGVLFGWLKTKSADTRVAQAQTGEAQAKQQAAEVRSAADQANAAAAQAGEQAIANRAKADQDAAALAPGDFDAELERLGALRKDKQL